MPAREEAHGNPRSAGPEDLAPAHGGEQGVARVLLRPDAGESAGIELDVLLEAGGRRRPDGVPPPDVGDVTVLAHRAGRSDVGVGARDDAQLEGVRAELRLLLEALLQRVAHEAPGLLRVAHEGDELPREVAEGELLEAAELVLGVHADAALRIALVLHDLDQALDVGAGGARRRR